MLKEYTASQVTTHHQQNGSAGLFIVPHVMYILLVWYLISSNILLYLNHDDAKFMFVSCFRFLGLFQLKQDEKQEDIALDNV